jgi:2,3-bisphosphoglycerate-dependent phosphoglycerate mutase
MKNFKLFSISILFLFFLSIQVIQAQSVTVFLTRHAEKATNDPKDPDLSESGKKRAESLVSLFENQKIDRFFSTPYKRTRQTLSDLAKAKGKEVVDYSPMTPDLLIEQIRKLENETVFISGHSNTIPDLVNRFTKTTSYATIDDSRYGDLWMLTLVKGEVVSVVEMKL